jgi:hypothetical protein
MELQPTYYNSGEFDVIGFCLLHKIGFCEGNVIKYVVRAGKKKPETLLEDLLKAREYLNRIIKNVENGMENGTKKG